MGTIHERRQRGDTFAGYTDLEVLVCPTCAVLYAAPERLIDDRRERGAGHYVYCPNGHNIHWPGPTEADKLRKRLRLAEDSEARAKAARDQAEASARAQKAAATRARNQRDKDRTRVANGVCPCCNRSFKDLRRHMASQHPDYGPLGEHE